MERAADKPKLTSVLDDSQALAGFSRLNVAMVISNPQSEDNPIVYVNDAFERTTGYNRAAVIGRNCRFLQGTDTDPEAVRKIRSAIEAGEDVSVDILNYRASGEPFMNRLLIAPILGARGKPVYFLGIQKELRDDEQDQANDSARLHLDTVCSRVSKDLGLIVTSLVGKSDAKPPTTEEERQKFLRTLDVLPRRLECLQFVYEEMQLADEQWNRDGIDLGSLLSRISHTIAHNEGRPGVRFVSLVEPLEVNLDTAIRVALMTFELVSNAFQHAFDGLDQGYLELRVNRLAAGGLRMTIADDGVGIPKKQGFPSSTSVGGRLVSSLLDGLDATLNVARGAAGTVIMIDVPVGFTDIRE
ncbi:PAS domain-containing protein [Marivita hallyeonensis]|uniref:PAS domain S-box-containing protein n=1 Tax=Marivita hallyeonensis TaxID=996342 RepID=A0A1M5WCI0_9RHOB|nr:PAS domain-containing protein [Marivita hallyeonensis]SHH85160.1 PAS domain S-box-containing protein [Marivita hallyeonensis]